MARKRFAVLVCGMLFVSVLAVTADATQKSKSSSRKAASSAKSEKKAKDTVASPWRRLPSGYGALKLTAEQKDEIYEARVDYGAQIDALEQQITALREEMDDDCIAVLTSTQKKSLTALIAKKGSGKTTAVKKASSRKTPSRKKSTASKSKKKSGSKKGTR
jgi:Spy/CpxP family protein refolding chaperone